MTSERPQRSDSAEKPPTGPSFTDVVLHLRSSFAKKEFWTALGKECVAAGIGGVVGAFAVYPIDISKTFLMNQASGLANTNYKSMWDVMKTVTRTQGISGLYKGVSANLIGVFPEKALKLAVNKQLLAAMGVERHETKMEYRAIAGGLAGFSQVLVTAPMERTKIMMSLYRTKFPNEAKLTERETLRRCVRHMWQSEGLLGFYRGTCATWFRDVPFSIVFFPATALIRSSLRNHFDWMRDHNMGADFTSGFLAGTGAAFLSTPLDVVKTHIHKQWDPKKDLKDSENRIIPCIRKLYADGGFRCFWNGAVPRSVIIAPLFGIAMLIFEGLSRFFGIEKKTGPYTMLVPPSQEYHEKEK